MPVDSAGSAHTLAQSFIDNEPAESSATLYLSVTLATVLVMLSGLFSGLNLGLMSFTDDDLGLVVDGSSDPDEVTHARQIRPVRSQGNLLLCTLLLGNTLVNAVIAVLLADMTSGLIGTCVTTGLIVVFGEIVPQSVCSRHALAIGAMALPVVKLFIIACYPIAYPISLLLNYLLGREVSAIFSRQGLIALIKLNVESENHAPESDVTVEDARLIGGALTYQDLRVVDAMTPIAECFCVPLDAVLDRKLIMGIVSRGHSRIPVYEGTPSNVVALLFVKDLAGVGFERELPLTQLLDALRARERVRCVGKETKLSDALRMCQVGIAHLLIVAGEGEGETRRCAAPALGVATIEDFLEEVLQQEIVDEDDVVLDEPLAAPEVSHQKLLGPGTKAPKRAKEWRRELKKGASSGNVVSPSDRPAHDPTALLRALPLPSSPHKDKGWFKQLTDRSSTSHRAARQARLPSGHGSPVSPATVGDQADML